MGPVSTGHYHRYRRGIAILLANTNTDTDTKVLLIRIMPLELWTALFVYMPHWRWKLVSWEWNVRIGTHKKEVSKSPSNIIEDALLIPEGHSKPAVFSGCHIEFLPQDSDVYSSIVPTHSWEPADTFSGLTWIGRSKKVLCSLLLVLILRLHPSQLTFWGGVGY